MNKSKDVHFEDEDKCQCRRCSKAKHESWEERFLNNWQDESFNCGEGEKMMYDHLRCEDIIDFIRQEIATARKKAMKEVVQIITDAEKDIHGGGNGRRIMTLLKGQIKNL